MAFGDEEDALSGGLLDFVDGLLDGVGVVGDAVGVGSGEVEGVGIVGALGVEGGGGLQGGSEREDSEEQRGYLLSTSLLTSLERVRDLPDEGSYGTGVERCGEGFGAGMDGEGLGLLGGVGDDEGVLTVGGPGRLRVGQLGEVVGAYTDCAGGDESGGVGDGVEGEVEGVVVAIDGDGSLAAGAAAVVGVGPNWGSAARFQRRTFLLQLRVAPMTMRERRDGRCSGWWCCRGR